MSSYDPASELFRAHEGGKLRITSTMTLDSKAALSIAYTPGVAAVCTAIADEPGAGREVHVALEGGGGGQ